MASQAGAPPAARTADAAAPIRIDLGTFVPPPRAPTRRYHCGVHPKAPFESDTRGGVTFQKYEGKLEFKEDGSLVEPKPLGIILELTDAQIDLMKERVANRRIRASFDSKGRVKECRHFSIASKARDGTLVPNPHYEPASTDEPLGKYLYCQPMSELMPEDFRAKAPPCMVR